MNLRMHLFLATFVLLSLVKLSFAATGPKLILKNVKYVDLDSGAIEATNLVFENGKYSKIADLPTGDFRLVDAKGRYVVPGLWDMHAHLHGDAAKLEKLPRHGVLGVRDAGVFKDQSFNLIEVWNRNSMNAGTIPTFVGSGYIHNGSKCEVKEHANIDDRVQLAEAIKIQRKRGYGLFKIHNCFPKALFKPLNQLGKRHRIAVFGHIPQGFDPIEYAKLGPSSIEHIDILVRALSFRESSPLQLRDAVKLLEGEYLDRLADTMIDNKVALTPTLVAYENFINTLPEKNRPLGRAVLNKLQTFTKRLSDRGVLLLAGTDLGLPGLKPGESLHRELALMVESGLSPVEAIRTATTNPDRYFRNAFGDDDVVANRSVLILEGNPLEDLDNLGRIHGYVKAGKLKVLEK